MVAMPIAILLLGLVFQSLGTAGQDQQDIEGRTETLTNGQIGLERMTRELRQASWVYFRSSGVVDMDVPVRVSATSTSVHRLVRYDCSGATCNRSEGPAVAYPPPAVPTFAATQTAIGNPPSDAFGLDGEVVNHDVFRPSHIDPDSGVRTTDFVAPDFVLVRLQLAYRARRGDLTLAERFPVVLEDGVSLRNRTTFAG
jgi:hypothetical protein